MFEYHPKCLIWIFGFWHISPIFVQLKLTCLETLFDIRLQFFLKSPKLTIFHQLLFTLNVARNVNWDFFCDFQTLCIYLILPAGLFTLVQFIPSQFSTIKIGETHRKLINLHQKNCKMRLFEWFLNFVLGRTILLLVSTKTRWFH